MAINDNAQVEFDAQPMRLYVFKSRAKNKLRAFTDDLAGSKLPDRLGPWHAVGAIAPAKDPPYTLPRGEIEESIRDRGFALWRMVPKKKK